MEGRRGAGDLGALLAGTLSGTVTCLGEQVHVFFKRDICTPVMRSHPIPGVGSRKLTHVSTGRHVHCC